MYSTMHVIGLAVALAVCASAPAGILPPHAVVEGKTIGDWTADWWIWALSIPTPDSPLLDETGQNANNAQQGPVFFIGGTLGGDVERTFTVPPGRHLLVPLVNNVACQGVEDDTEEELRALCGDFINAVDYLQATVNGVNPGALFLHREVTSGTFEFTVPDDNVGGFPFRDSGLAVSDGYWLMFEPLAEGQSLNLVYGGGVSVFGWSVLVTAHITAVLDQVATGHVYVSASDGSDLTGDGSETRPWKTISFAMARVVGLLREVSIHLAAGRYVERVEFQPGVRLIGADPQAPEATVVAPAATQLTTGGYVVVAAENTVIRDLTVELPLDAPPSQTLLFVNNVKMIAENVILNGRDVPDSIGMSMLDEGSSDSLITRSTVKRLDDGVRVVESGANFTESLFEDIRFDAVFVRQPLKGHKAGVSPVFGDETQTTKTGANKFVNVQGYFVRNFTSDTIKAELNDWGFDTEEEIARKMQGSVDFVPFLKSGLLLSSLICVVTDGETGLPILNAQVSIPSYPEVTENIHGAYLFAALTADRYTVSASAPGYQAGSHTVNVDAGKVVKVTLELASVGDVTPPAILIGPPSLSFVASRDVVFPVVYDGADVVTLTADDVIIHRTGSASATANVSGAGTASREVVLTGVEGAGTLCVSLRAGTASDQAGNLAGAAGPSDLVIVVQCDVTGDACTDAMDVQTLVNAVLGIPGTGAADLNGDGYTDALDIQLVVNAVLGII